ncbi:MAG: RNA pyrophosphohydrolase [Leptospiraceae bacterium]|nr:RNA pyrophosphohydrolase [Leptospiraceae bacterium]
MKPYRKNVGIVIFNSSGKVLVGERAGMKGNWQFPQGGIDEGEDIDFAAKRELYEEVGIKDAEKVYEHPDWLNYDFPETLKIKMAEKYRGQSQKWLLFYWDHPAEDCNLTVHEREFDTVVFMELEATIESIVPFKKDVYKSVIESFGPKIKEYLGK